MTLKNRWFILILCLGLLLPAVIVHAEDTDESKVVKAADAIIKGLPDACKAGLDFSKMTPAQRIDFVITGAESKIQDEVAGRIQEAMKGRLETYAKEKIRAKVFMEIGVPQIRNAYVLGRAVNWTKINNEIASKVETNMAAIGAGIKAAQIGWGAIAAYQTGDLTSVARSIGGEISDMLAEAYIPGYGYIKAGAAMVEFLGNYVLDYATDTAVEGMLNSMYGKKSNPQGLAQWLIDKSPQDIMKDLDGKWNDGEAFGYVFREQGTDKGDEAMKSRLQTVLINMRGEVLVKKKEQEEKEKQAQQDIEDYLQKYRSAKDAVEAVASQAKADFDVKFAPILEFKKKLNVFRKEDVQESLVEIEGTMDDIGPGGAGSSMDYTPFKGGPLISEMQGAYSEIKEIPSGYDAEAMIRMVSEYRRHRQEAIESTQKANAANRLKARARVDEQIKPIQQQMDALHARMGAASSNLAKYNALNHQVNEIGNQYWLACVENLRKQGVDFAAFAAEEKIVELEAQVRADKLNVSIEEGFKKIEAGIQIAQRERDAANKALLNEVQDKFSFPSLYSINEFVKTATCSGICGPAESIKNGVLELYAPGSLHAAREKALSNIEKIQQDMKLVSVYSAKEKEILKQYQIQILNLRKAFESLVPENLRFTPGTGETPEDAAYRKREDDSVKKYGARYASQETWGVGSAPYVNFPSRVLSKTVEPIRYFDIHIADLDVLEKQRDQQFEEGLKNIQDMVSTIDFYADLDRIAVSIKSMGNNLQKVLGPYIGVNLNFRTKNGKTDLLVPAAASDGAKSLEEMKKAWEQYKPHVEKMRANVKAYGKGLKYIGADQGPDGAIAALAQFEAIPDTIASFEKRMAQTEAERVSSKAQVEEELRRLRGDLETLQNTKNLQVYERTLQNLRATFDSLLPHLDDGTMRGVFKAEYIKLRDDVEAYAKVHEASEKMRMEEYYRQQAADNASEARASQELEKRKQDEAGDLPDRETNAPKKIAEFYGQFRSAYEGRNDAQLISMLGDNWESGDGTTLADLQGFLRNSFSVFNEIRYAQSNIQFLPAPQGVFKVTYDLTITGRIYAENITHEEKSTVSEELAFDERGRLRIVKTLGGRFWSVQ